MQPPSPFEEPTAPGDSTPSPRKKLPSMRVVLPGLAIVLIVAVLVGLLQIARGAGNTPRQASGPMPTATAAIASTTSATGATVTANDTPAPGSTPPPTATNNPPAPTADVRVTQNQNERQPCLNDPVPYTVTLFNAGTVSANWHVYIPVNIGLAPGGPNSGSQPLVSLPSSSPVWATAAPYDGSIAPGQSDRFVMTPIGAMPCGSTLYKAKVLLSFPSGGSQADIPLTFGGTGPAPYSNVVLASGSQTGTEVCPASGDPDPFTFAITNTGNYQAGQAIYETQYLGANGYWAGTSVTVDPPGPVPTLMYPGQIWTITVSPHAGISCTGIPYYVYIQINNAQGTTTTLTFTYTFTAS